MTKSEIIAAIAAKNPHLTVKDVTQIVNVVFEKISDSLAKGDRVEFRGFGSFSVRSRAARNAKNPRTGQPVFIAERKNIHFKTGKELHEMLNK